MFDFINLTLQEFIRKFNCEDVCLSYLEERFWNNVPVSPFDPSSKVYNYSKKLYVKGKAHTNGIEGFWSKVKRSFVGVYYKMSRKYLHLYMNEYVFRHNVAKENGLNRFNHFLTLANRHVPLKELVA